MKSQLFPKFQVLISVGTVVANLTIIILHIYIYTTYFLKTELVINAQKYIEKLRTKGTKGYRKKNI